MWLKFGLIVVSCSALRHVKHYSDGSRRFIGIFTFSLTTGPPYMTMQKAFNPSNWFCKDKPESLSNYVTRCKDRVTKGPCHKSELEAMEYVKAHTQIPIPQSATYGRKKQGSSSK